MLAAWGRWAQSQGMVVEAEEHCQRALRVLGRLVDSENARFEMGVTYSSLGEIENTRGDYLLAKNYLNKAKEIKAYFNDEKKGKGITLCFLGISEEGLKDYEQAQNYLVEARDYLEKKFPQDAYVGVAYRELGYVAYCRGEYSLADEYYQQAQKIADDKRDTQSQIVLFSRRAALAAAQNQPEEAERLYREGLNLAGDNDFNARTAETLQAFGCFLVEEQKNMGEGCSMLNDAWQLYTTLVIPKRQERVEKKMREFGCPIHPG